MNNDPNKELEKIKKYFGSSWGSVAGQISYGADEKSPEFINELINLIQKENIICKIITEDHLFGKIILINPKQRCRAPNR